MRYPVSCLTLVQARADNLTATFSQRHLYLPVDPRGSSRRRRFARLLHPDNWSLHLAGLRSSGVDMYLARILF